MKFLLAASITAVRVKDCRQGVPRATQIGVYSEGLGVHRMSLGVHPASPGIFVQHGFTYGK
ncbi:MAG: hypothetical protein LBL04_14705 [Bacteroidales bacterium]|nr:hypothetical protein [Bacteroidales bacterium]